MLNNLSAGDILNILVSIIIALSIHEAMHAFTAHWLGDTTAQDEGRLSLNPLRHIDPFTTIILPIITLVLFHLPVLAAKPVPFNPERVKFDEFGNALIAAAGPLTNLVLAVIGALLLHVAGNSVLLVNFLTTFIVLNVALLIFNLLPIPPLDGSRVLYAFAPEPLQKFMREIEPYGIMIVFALVLTGILTPLLINLNTDILRFLP